MPFNGPARELFGDQDHLEESVYCTQCGTIFVPNPTARQCPSCTLADRLDAIEEQLDDLEADDVSIAEHIVDSHETIDERLAALEKRVKRIDRDLDVVEGGV